eukprot:2295589-Lingulodinium_polyedra.AAC.1
MQLRCMLDCALARDNGSGRNKATGTLLVTDMRAWSARTQQRRTQLAQRTRCLSKLHFAARA